MRIAFLGDIALIGKYDLTTNPHAKDRLITISEKLKEFDYVVANLESPLTDIKKTRVCKSMHIRTATVNTELLNFLHVNAVSLANNHIHDFGVKGLRETISSLDNNGIEWFGVNSKYMIKEIKGEKVCFSGFCCYSTNGTGYIEGNAKEGINTLTYDNIFKQLERDKNNKAFSITSIHWGTEHTNYPNYEHIRLSEEIAAKRDVIIHGHHPHVIQGIQKIGGSLVAYSLGNCLFDDCTSITGSFSLKQNSNNRKAFMLDVNIDSGAILGYKAQGFKDDENGLALFDIDEELRQMSIPLEKIEDIELYKEIRRNQFDNTIFDKFGKHDFKWLKSRLNYYSLGASVSAKFRRKKYLREVQKFFGGKKDE